MQDLIEQYRRTLDVLTSRRNELRRRLPLLRGGERTRVLHRLDALEEERVSVSSALDWMIKRYGGEPLRRSMNRG